MSRKNRRKALNKGEHMANETQVQNNGNTQVVIQPEVKAAVVEKAAQVVAQMAAAPQNKTLEEKKPQAQAPDPQVEKAPVQTAPAPAAAQAPAAQAPATAPAPKKGWIESSKDWASETFGDIVTVRNTKRLADGLIFAGLVLGVAGTLFSSPLTLSIGVGALLGGAIIRFGTMAFFGTAKA